MSDVRALYVTRQRVMRAADVKTTAYATAETDAAIESASQAVDSLCKLGDETRPGFAPWTGSISFDWPVLNNDDSYRLYLNQHRLYSLSALTIDGDTETSNALPWPASGPPYSALELDEASGAIFTFSSGSGQRSIGITGVWCGCSVNELTSSTWQLSGSLTASATTATLNAPLGVGSIVRIDSERMFVTEQNWATSGQTVTCTSSMADNVLTVSDATVFYAGEEILVGGERMLVRDRAGTTLIVQRSVGGSSLAAHTATTIYWARSCVVTRGALGTTAATHSSAAPIYVYKAPALIEQLTVAYALDQGQQEQSSYARTTGQGEGERPASGAGIRALEKRVLEAYGRQLRFRSV